MNRENLIQYAIFCIVLSFLISSARSQTTAEEFTALRQQIAEAPLQNSTKDFISELMNRAEENSALPWVSSDVVGKELITAICAYKYALLFDNGSMTPEEASEAADALFPHAAAIVLNQLVQMFNPFGLAPFPANPKPAPAAACKVNILLNLGGRPVDPVNKFFTEPRRMVSFQAEGMPAGGTYSWSLDPADPTLAGLATSSSNGKVDPHSTFFAKRTGSYQVKVTYTCNNGKEAEDTVTLKVR